MKYGCAKKFTRKDIEEDITYLKAVIPKTHTKVISDPKVRNILDKELQERKQNKYFL
jgi:hypothetical protein